MPNPAEGDNQQILPHWAVPGLICALALVGALVINARLGDQGRSLDIAVARDDRANSSSGSIGPAPDGDLGIDRDQPPDGEATIGALDTGQLSVHPQSSGLPWSVLGAGDGLLTFRGNPTRTYHGRGPIPERPVVQWSTSIGCANSPVGGEPKQWCGTGWTGQPAVFRAPSSGAASGSTPGSTDNDWWVAVGGYNRSVNFFEPSSGEQAYPPFPTADIIKGSITVDPDGYPLVYTGSRDNYFHIVAIDGDEPQELWRLSSASEDPTLWNNDWDSSAMVLDDYLFVGGENSRFYVVALNRSFDDRGRVAVEPEVVFSAAGWDSELLTALGDRQVSIENSVAISGQTVYFTNSGGLVQGWNIADLDRGGNPQRVFRYWTGDDTDASIVIDEEGMLYVASEYERGNARSRQLGQVLKLDPSSPEDPLVWGIEANRGLNTGVWATPAIHGDLLIVSTDDGRVLGIERDDGRIRWTIELPGPLWSSPVVVDETLVQGDCSGTLHAFDLSDQGRRPTPLWQVELQGCIESTPAVWDGQIFVGTRSGTFYAIGDRA